MHGTINMKEKFFNVLFGTGKITVLRHIAIHCLRNEAELVLVLCKMMMLMILNMSCAI